MKKPRFEVNGFTGTVVLKEWTPGLDGRNYNAWHGRVSIIDASEAVGFEVRDRDASWLARVESPHGDQAWNFPGCQIRAIHVGPIKSGHRDVYVVA